MLIFILQNLCCPLRAIPDFIDNILIKFRFMADQKDTAAVFPAERVLIRPLRQHPDGWSARLRAEHWSIY